MMGVSRPTAFLLSFSARFAADRGRFGLLFWHPFNPLQSILVGPQRVVLRLDRAAEYVDVWATEVWPNQSRTTCIGTPPSSQPWP